MHLLEILKGLVDWQGPLLAALVFVPLERLVPARKQAVLRKGWRTDAAYLIVNAALFRLGLVFVVAVLVSAIGLHPLPATQAFLAKQPLWLTAGGAVIVGDFCLYWAHRAIHASPTLWRFHAIHHDIEALDWAGAYHSHVVDAAVLSGASLGTVYLLGFPPAAIAIYGAVYAWMSLAVHANVRIGIGPLGRIFSSPRFHHWHHSNEPEARDRNFASIFALWDVAFGTALPTARMPRVYGTDNAVPADYAGQLAYPFRRPAPDETPYSAASLGR